MNAAGVCVYFLGSYCILKFYEYTLRGVWVPIRYSSTAHNISWVLFVFNLAVNLSWNRDSIGYGAPMLVEYGI